MWKPRKFDVAGQKEGELRPYPAMPVSQAWTLPPHGSLTIINSVPLLVGSGIPAGQFVNQLLRTMREQLGPRKWFRGNVAKGRGLGTEPATPAEPRTASGQRRESPQQVYGQEGTEEKGGRGGLQCSPASREVSL